ncbi:MAG: DUF2029 domain-containing protein [Clostridia bacterium]|nr:DUF2029 domain-containing protein [Clostridia bacterium]
MNKIFPTQHILTVSFLSMAAYLVLFLCYSSFKKKNALKLASDDGSDRNGFLIGWLLFAAFAVRIALSCYLEGHKTDINCFTIWGNNLASGGFRNFYSPTSGMPDYPPGYMYVLGLMSSIARALGHGVYDQFGNYDLVYVAFIKLPSIIADLAAAYLVYRLAIKRLRFAPAFLLAALVAFNPVMLYISGGWGQIDQILTVLIVLAMLALNANKPILGGVIYGFAILMKPQALMVGPLMALAYFMYIFDPDFFKHYGEECKDDIKTRIGKTAIAVAAAFALIIIAAIPFASKELPLFKLIWDKYLGTATSYKFASVNAYNIFTLFGKNWTRLESEPILGVLGTIGMVISVAGGGVLYWFGRKKNRGALYLAAAFTFVSLFTLGHYMHERYLFPMLLLLFMAYLYYHDRRLLYAMLAYTATAMVNCLAAFYYSKYHEFNLYWDDRIVFWCSLANVLLFIAFTVLCVFIMIKGRTAGDVFDGELAEEELLAKPAAKAARSKPAK